MYSVNRKQCQYCRLLGKQRNTQSHTPHLLEPEWADAQWVTAAAEMSSAFNVST